MQNFTGLWKKKKYLKKELKSKETFKKLSTHQKITKCCVDVGCGDGDESDVGLSVMDENMQININIESICKKKTRINAFKKYW